MRRYCSPSAWGKLHKYRASQYLLLGNVFAAFGPAFRIWPPTRPGKGLKKRARNHDMDGATISGLF
jgi:hypothetical protein